MRRIKDGLTLFERAYGVIRHLHVNDSLPLIRGQDAEGDAAKAQLPRLGGDNSAALSTVLCLRWLK